MLTNINRTTNINAVSKINDENVLFLTASITKNGTFNINENIINKSLYFANEDEVRADSIEFRTEVEEIAKNMTD